MSQYPAEASHRVAGFKNSAKSTDEMRRVRNEVSIELRKARRDEQLQKRRNIVSGAKQSSSPDIPKSVEVTPEKIIEDILSGDDERKFSAVLTSRKLLSRERYPPIDKMIKAGLVPILVECLSDSEHSGVQFEAAWALTNIASGTTEQTAAVIEAGAIPKLVSLLRSPHLHIVEQAVWALGNIAGDGAYPRDMVLDAGVMNYLLEVVVKPEVPVSFLRNVVWTISNLCRNKNPPPDFEKVSPCLPLLSQLLHCEDNDILADCCWALSYLTDGTNDKIQHIINLGVVPTLVQLLSKGVKTVDTPALRIIGNIVTGSDEQTDEVLKHGALERILPLLQSSRNNIVKEATWTISNITAGNRNQIQMVIDAEIIPIIINILQKGDFKSQKEAIWVVTNFTSGCSLEQLWYLINAGVIPPLCNLLDNKDAKIVSVLLDGINNILKAAEQMGKHEDIALMIEECGGLDKLEALQLHSNEVVYDKTMCIIESYFSNDDEADSTEQQGDNEITFQPPDNFSAPFNLN